MEELAGLGVGSTSKWKTKAPSQRSLRRVSEFFNVSIGWLLGETESRLPTQFEKWGEEFNGKRLAESSSRMLRGLRVPVFDYLVTDKVREFSDAVSWLELDYEFEGDPSVYGYLVPDDSMAPRINAGDVVLIHLQNTATNGDILTISVDGGSATLCKFYEFGNDTVLAPIGYHGDLQYVASSSVVIFGRAFEVRSKL